MSGANPLFSVLCSTYNHARFLEEALDGVAGQQCQDFELVVVDDGSTDDTPAVFERWRSQFCQRNLNRVVGLRMANGGQSAALEAGFAQCTGRYIALLDSDDRWLPGKLSAVAKAAGEHPEVGMIVHPQFVIGPMGVRTGDTRPKRAKLSRGDMRSQMRLTGRHVAGATSGITLRADVFRQLLPMPTKGFRSAADQYLSFGATVLEPVYALDEPQSEYRVHQDGQYIQRMMTPQGVERQLELQRTIVAHFGLESVIDRNPFFARHRFAVAKFRESFRAQVRAYILLVRALWIDRSFSPAQKLAFTGFWGAGLIVPRGMFLKQWRWFQLKQTGRDRLPAARPI